MESSGLQLNRKQVFPLPLFDSHDMTMKLRLGRLNLRSVTKGGMIAEDLSQGHTGATAAMVYCSSVGSRVSVIQPWEQPVLKLKTLQLVHTDVVVQPPECCLLLSISILLAPEFFL